MFFSVHFFTAVISTSVLSHTVRFHLFISTYVVGCRNSFVTYRCTFCINCLCNKSIKKILSRLWDGGPKSGIRFRTLSSGIMWPDRESDHPPTSSSEVRKCLQFNILSAFIVWYLINPLALELDIQSLAHHLCKMWIFYEPRILTLGNTRYFVEQ